jgi:hypothetical protein
MSKKAVNYTIEEGAHARIKARAKMFNMTTGDYIEQLLSSSEIRLENLLQVVGLHEDICPNVQDYMHLCLAIGSTQEHFTDTIKNWVRTIDANEEFKDTLSEPWKPELKPLTKRLENEDV